jgi:hypothetical protein
MHSRGLGGSRFDAFAKIHTRFYTTSMLMADVIRGEEDARNSLRHFYDMVNHFNLDYYQFLEPGAPPALPSTQVYSLPVTALGVISNLDVVITNGQPVMTKVGLGEVKPSWVVTRANVSDFMGRLPFTHFGEQFIAVPGQEQETLMVGRALTQIYGDMITDGLSIGFLATTDVIIYCLIPPEDRTSVYLYSHRVYREDRPWEIDPTRFTVQVGLATLAWIAKTRYSTLHPRPHRQKVWGSPQQL